MASHIRMGKGGTLDLPLDAATQTFAFIGRKRSGKTYAAGRLFEGLVKNRVQCVVLDLVGKWYGVRLAANGGPSGLDVPVIGGLRGDVPLEPTAGALIADLVADTGRSLVLDISQMSQADRQRFATAFGERLWARQKAEMEPAPIHLFIEEAQTILPQMVGKDQTKMVHIYNEIIRLGGNFGIGVSLITQRPQSVNKEGLTQTECIFAFQLNGLPERKTMREWLTHAGGDVNLSDELPTLEVGHPYVWSPQWLEIFKQIQIEKKATYDSSRTVRVGEKRVERELKPIDLAELQKRMATTIEKSKMEDPRHLKAEIARWRKLAEAKAPFAVAAPAAGKEQRKEVAQLRQKLTALSKLLENAMKFIVAVNARGFSAATPEDAKKLQDAIAAAVESATKVLEGRVSAFQKQLAEHRKQGERIVADVEKFLKSGNVPIVVDVAKQPEFAVSAPVRRPPTGPTPKPYADGSSPPARKRTGKEPSAEERVLVALASYYPEQISKKQLTVLTGFKRSTRNTYIQRLGQQGLVESSGDVVGATEAGAERAAELGFEPLPKGQALIDYWRDNLSGGERDIFELLVEAYPEAVDREAISEKTGFTRSTRNTYLQRLDSRGVLGDAKAGHAKAADELFEEG